MTDENAKTPNVRTEREVPNDELQRELCERINAPLERNARVVLVLNVSKVTPNGGVNITGNTVLLFDENTEDSAVISGKCLRRMFRAVAQGFAGPSMEEIVGAAFIKAGETMRGKENAPAKDDGAQEDTEEVQE